MRERVSERAGQAWVANSFAPYSTAVERPTTTFSQCCDYSARIQRANVNHAAPTGRNARASVRYVHWSRSSSHWLFLKAVSRYTERGVLCLRTSSCYWISRGQEYRDWPTGPRGLQARDARGTYTRATPMVRSSGWKTLKWGGLTRTSVPEGPATVRALRPSPDPGGSGSSKQRNDQRN